MGVPESDPGTILQLSPLCILFQQIEFVEHLGAREHRFHKDQITIVIEAAAPEGGIQRFGLCWIFLT